MTTPDKPKDPSGIQEMPVSEEHWRWLAEVFSLHTDARIKPEELATILSTAKVLHYPEGSVVVKEKDYGEDLYVIRKGRAQVSRRTRVLAELMSGNYFGEIGYLLHVPRTATVSSEKGCEVIRIDAAALKRLAERIPELVETMRDAAKRRVRKLQEDEKNKEKGDAA